MGLLRKFDPFAGMKGRFDPVNSHLMGLVSRLPLRTGRPVSGMP
jgi:hypothetical protein